MKITCPKCESEDVQRLAMIYQRGTATTVSSSTTLGDVGGYLAVGGSVLSATQQSLLAQQATPPLPRMASDWSYVFGFIVLVCGVVTLVVAFSLALEDLPITLIVGGMITVVGITAFLSARASARDADQYNRTTYPRLKEAWERTWLCLRCGNRFEASP